ncbi:hypothetical protein G7054_g4128 [Neopestalotiopsis clavispora]|nr:hypothetical protein G7054_g4128 [Neopestalotiopsis clavispora]
MPVLDPELIGRGLNEITHQLARRDVDHRVLETLAVGRLFNGLSQSSVHKPWFMAGRNGKHAVQVIAQVLEL